MQHVQVKLCFAVNVCPHSGRVHTNFDTLFRRALLAFTIFAEPTTFFQPEDGLGDTAEPELS